MTVEIRDPLALLPYQASLVVTPLQEQAAEGHIDLDVPQRSIVIGEPVPIIFCLRADGNGGVLVSPGATEGRYENAAVTNTLTMNLQLVLTEGNLVDSLTPSQLYQGNCRQGSWLRSYNRRAGAWTPGNFITAVSGTTYWNCPVECGSSGNYADLTTLSFTNTYLDEDEAWRNQIHCFINSGISVPRILIGTSGASSNIVDLALYLIRETSRYNEDLIDLTAMTEAATFADYNDFFYQGVFYKSTNLETWLEEISISFLLRVTDQNGKRGLRPRLPFNSNGSIDTSTVTWVYGFTEADVLPNGFEIEYIPLPDRQSIVVQMLWRQQPQNYAGLMRTLEVRFTDEAADGPFEQYDLSDFCTNETHAVKVGVYHAARRKYITHTLRLHVRPGSYNSILTQGDIVRVRLQRETNEDDISLHDYLYEVERIDRRFEGKVVLDLMHLPIDDEGRSIVAQLVNTATAPGYSYSTGPYTLTCSVNADNTTPITDSGGNFENLPGDEEFEYDVTGITPAAPTSDINNPADPFEDNELLDVIMQFEGPAAGSVLGVEGFESGDSIQWQRNGVPISGATGSTYTPGAEDIGSSIGYTRNGEASETVTPFNPLFDFSAFIQEDFDVTIFYAYTLTGSETNCDTSVVTPVGTGNIGSINATGVNFGTATADIDNPGALLSGSMAYNNPCGNGGNTLNLNGQIVQYQTSAPGFYENKVPIGVWGANISPTVSNKAYNLKGTTVITDIVLREDVPGLGNNGQSVRDKGLEWLYNGWDGQQYVKDTGTTITFP